VETAPAIAIFKRAPASNFIAKAGEQDADAQLPVIPSRQCCVAPSFLCHLAALAYDRANQVIAP
jgi:hypothetical protein